MKTKLMALVTALVLLITVNVPAFAAVKPASSDSDMHIMYTNTDSASAYLDFSGTRADCSAIVEGKSGTTQITATVYLKRVVGSTKTTVKAWTGLSTSGETFYFDNSYYVSSGYTYEVEIKAKVYRNGTAESISVSCQDYCG
ncbi:hypothetical protein ACRQU7_18625 [Caproiciproducens sp. R1]|uniref:hypothetical protein n=1 Tax=Caproiciproducens sp. R1 TaxID=3435000 RepID=UPI004034C436